MSRFTSVDQSPEPASLVGYLERSAGWLRAMKAYMATAIAGAAPGGSVLDLGCGAGHDLALLEDLGMEAVGVDPSRTMLDASASRVAGARLVQGDGARLPFAEASFDGCRVERVLQHVEEPGAVLAEVGRVLRPGGALAVFEPDWTSWRADTELAGADAIASELHNVRHPDIGARLPELVEAAGFQITDIVTEASVVDSISRMPIDVEVSVARAVERGRVDRELALRWLVEQRSLDAQGRFRVRQSKVLVLARCARVR